MNLPKYLTVFFGDNGLSQTEANHQANMVKEINGRIERDFKNTGAVTESVEIFDGKETKKVPLDSKAPVKDLKLTAMREGELFALSAWLREAIKAKSTLLDKIRTAPDKEFLLEDETYPVVTMEMPMFEEPAAQVMVTEQDIIGEFTIRERSEYYTLEAIAAHLGKKLHNGGILSQIREELQVFVPYRFQDLNNNGGKHSFPVERVPLYKQDVFEGDFFWLQETHRSTEARLNWYKARIQNAVTERNAEGYKAYREVYDAAYAKYQKELLAFTQHVEDIRKQETSLRNTLNQRRLQMTRDVSAWKIIIPDELQHLLEFVKSAGK